MFVDILFLCAGVYLMYMTVKMKASGEISPQLIGKKTDLSKAKDPKGYIDAIYPRSIFFGAMLIAIAALGLVNYYLSLSVWINLFVFVAYIAGIIYYSCVSVKFQRKFLV